MFIMGILRSLQHVWQQHNSRKALLKLTPSQRVDMGLETDKIQQELDKTRLKHVLFELQQTRRR